MTEPLDDLLDREEKYLLAHFIGDECDIMPGDIQGTFHRVREALRAASVPQCGAEPVAWQIIGADGSPSSVTREPDLVKSWNENCYKYRPLYAAPPELLALSIDPGTVAVTSTDRGTP